jgi:hypothetical protein
MAFATSTALAGPPPNRLDHGSGSNLQHPHIVNFFWDPNWDSDPNYFSEATINDATTRLMNSDYLAGAAQYGVFQGSFIKSYDNPACGGKPGASMGEADIFARVTCQVYSISAPGGGGPDPIGDTSALYVVWLPAGTSVNYQGGNTCSAFAAYHLFSAYLYQTFPFAVMPIDCASNKDALTELLSHEVVESATDKVPPVGAIDTSLFDFNNLPKIFMSGEAADICSAASAGAVPTPSVRLDGGILVAPYWSNADNACVPFAHTLSLNAAGLPAGTAATAILDGATVSLPYSELWEAARYGCNLGICIQTGVHTYSFATPVPGTLAGTRYWTDDVGGTVILNSDISVTGHYRVQWELLISTVPATLDPAATGLQPVQWLDAGGSVSLSASPVVTAGADRYAFDHWAFDAFTATSPTITLLVERPAMQVEADYVLRPPPVITWATPADITYPTALSGTQLNAIASVAGSFAYSPPTGTVLPAGVGQTVTVTFTPTDASYSTVSTTVSINVLKATPLITWATPADITYPTALSGTQLNATASVAGSFAYSPPTGTVLPAGVGQTLTVTFTPTDASYSTVSTTVSISVLKASQVITFGPIANKTFGDIPFSVSATASSGLTVSFAASGACTVTGSVVTITRGGACTITASQAGSANYNAATPVSQTFSIAVIERVAGVETSLPTGCSGGSSSSFFGLASGPLIGFWSAAICHTTLDKSATILGGTFVLNSKTATVRGSFTGGSVFLVGEVDSFGLCIQTFTVSGTLTDGTFNAVLTHYGVRTASGCRVFFATINGTATLTV